MPDNSETLTLKQVAEKLGRSRQTIRAWVKRGVLTASQMVPKGRYSFDINQLQEDLEKAKIRPT